MKKIKTSSVEKSIWKIRRRFEKNMECDYWHVFANIEAGPKDVECSWFYQLWANVNDQTIPVTAEYGTSESCNCDECTEFAIEVLELRSLVAAIGRICPDSQSAVWLWVTSRRLVETDDVVRINGDAEIECASLRELLYWVNWLFHRYGFVFRHYSVENKDLPSTVNFDELKSVRWYQSI